MKVKDILRTKGTTVHTIEPQATVYDAIKKMDDYNIGSLLVMTGEHLDGILSERDYRTKIILKGRTSRETPVEEIMTDNVYCVTREVVLEQCMALMTEQKIRHLPVVEEENVIGIISIGDIVKAIISDQRIKIDHLENYIYGRYPA